MRRGSSLLIAIVALSGILLLFLGSRLYLITQPPRMETQITHIIPTQALALKLDDKIKAFEQRVLQAQVGEVISITITQEEATSKLDEIIKRVDLPVEVKTVVVNFKNGQILVLGKVSMNLEVNIGIVVRVDVDNEGKPRIAIKGIDIGRGARLPPGMVEELASLIPDLDALADNLRKLPLKLERVVIDEGLLMVTAEKVQSIVHAINTGGVGESQTQAQVAPPQTTASPQST